jgi:hypothetical protein
MPSSPNKGRVRNLKARFVFVGMWLLVCVAVAVLHIALRPVSLTVTISMSVAALAVLIASGTFAVDGFNHKDTGLVELRDRAREMRDQPAGKKVYDATTHLFTLVGTIDYLTWIIAFGLIMIVTSRLHEELGSRKNAHPGPTTLDWIAAGAVAGFSLLAAITVALFVSKASRHARRSL